MHGQQNIKKDKEQVPYCEPTNIRRHCVLFSQVICAFLHGTGCRRKLVLIFKIMTEIWDTAHHRTSEAGFALIFRYSWKQRGGGVGGWGGGLWNQNWG